MKISLLVHEKPHTHGFEKADAVNRKQSTLFRRALLSGCFRQQKRM